MIPKFENAFYGSQLSDEQADIVTVQNIPQKLLEREPGLMQKKWFDYRRMHPAVATYLFVSEYIRAYKKLISVTYDIDAAKYKMGVRQDDFMNSRECNTFWKLRQKADECGVRYDFFMRSAMTWCAARGWTNPPRPSQIYNNNDMVVSILNDWSLECRAKIQYPEDPHFLVENWAGSPEQLSYERWLIDRIKEKRIPMYSLNSAIYEMGVLRIETALEHFPQKMVDEATDYCLRVQSFNESIL